MSNRVYPYKDVDMVMGCNVVMKRFNRRKERLINERPKWADPFAPNLEARIKNALKILGVNTKDVQTAATRVLKSEVKQAITDLKTFKIQLEIDFEEEPEKGELILKKLGFDRHYKEASKEEQEGSIEMLWAFNENMTPELRQEIIDSGTKAELIDGLLGMGDVISDLNVDQEDLKDSTKKDTAVNVDELNAIYKQVIGICKLAPRFLPDVPSASDDFSFSKIISMLH